jgi:hydroxymethylglutaryl-CoA lyase
MTSLPRKIEIVEEGPREGFQIEKGPIATERKIELIDALSKTGLKRIVAVSFVNPKLVPGMADAEAVMQGIKREPGVRYHAICLNARGVERALESGHVDVTGSLIFSASEPFLMKNQNKNFEGMLEEQDKIIQLYKSRGIPVTTASVAAVFGCNFKGDVPIRDVIDVLKSACDLAERNGEKLQLLNLADTMAWGTPQSIKRVVGAVQDAFPDKTIGLHLHDTRGMAIANAFAGLEMGVTYFESSVAGLGGCPFAGHKGAAGNVCTEDLVFMCDEMGIETGIDLEAMIECARLAEDIVGHPLPGAVMRGGSVRSLRNRISAGL